MSAATTEANRLKEAQQKILESEEPSAGAGGTSQGQGKNLEGLFNDQPQKKNDKDLNDLF